MYTDITRSWDPIFGYKRAAARCGWRVGGICMDSMLEYVVLSMASIVLAEARLFSYYNERNYIPVCIYQFVVS